MTIAATILFWLLVADIVSGVVAMMIGSETHRTVAEAQFARAVTVLFEVLALLVVSGTL